MVPIEQKDWTEEDRASKLGQNHPLNSTKRQIYISRTPYGWGYLHRALSTEMVDTVKQEPKLAAILAADARCRRWIAVV